MSKPDTLLRTSMTETSRQAINRGLAVKLQEALNEDLISRLLMKEKKHKDDTVVARQESLRAVQDDTEVADRPLSSAQLAFIRQTMTTWKSRLCTS